MFLGAGGWDQADDNNAESFMSLTGYTITYAGRPVLCCSRLHMEVVLSTIEAEFIALSQSMHNVIPFIVLMK